MKLKIPKRKKRIIVPEKVVYINNFIPSETRPHHVYRGMNWWAAQELKAPFPYPKDTVVITKWDMSGQDVALHERTEAKFMQEGLKYDEAHAKTVALTGVH